MEEDLENMENKYVLAMQKYDKAATTADDSDRMAKVLQNRAQEDEKKMQTLAEQLKEAQKIAEDADIKYDEASKKMQLCENQLEIDGERADLSEFKIVELEEELKVVANNLKSLEVSEDKANDRETFYKDEIKRLTSKLKQSETRAEFAERSVQKLQKEVNIRKKKLVKIVYLTKQRRQSFLSILFFSEVANFFVSDQTLLLANAAMNFKKRDISIYFRVRLRQFLGCAPRLGPIAAARTGCLIIHSGIREYQSLVAANF